MSNKKAFDSVLQSIRRMEKNSAWITEILRPNKEFREQMERLLEPHYAIAQLAAEQTKAEQSLKDMFASPVTDVLSNRSDVLPLMDQSWADALALQSTLNLPDHISEALLGFKLESHTLKAMAAGIEPSVFEGIIHTLNYDQLFLGEYAIEDKDDVVDEADQEHESPIILPEKLENSLQAVNFLPITLFQKVLNDPDLMRQIRPRDFENFVADLIDKLGFDNVFVTPQSGDGGRDIIATQNVNDIPLVFAFECKQYAENRKIGPSTMRSLLGTINSADTKANVGVLVTTSSFTAGSKTLIAGETALDGKDFKDLVTWTNSIKRS